MVVKHINIFYSMYACNIYTCITHIYSIYIIFKLTIYIYIYVCVYACIHNYTYVNVNMSIY